MAPDSDDELTLSSSTMAALQAFYSERDDHAKRFADLQSASEAAADAREGKAADGAPGPGAAAAATVSAPLSMDLFTEDWNESQFWYADDTANLLARQLLDGADASSTVVVVSAPSVFVALKNQVAAISPSSRPKLVLLEHDNRFTVFGSEFIFYDFKEPTKLPASLKGTADRIICDPPFLSEDCQTKAALTVRWLSTKSPARLVVCTGERMADLITGKLYRPLGVQTTTFEPQHARGLSNEFYCYANFECEDWKWR